MICLSLLFQADLKRDVEELCRDIDAVVRKITTAALLENRVNNVLPVLTEWHRVRNISISGTSSLHKYQHIASSVIVLNGRG